MKSFPFRILAAAATLTVCTSAMVSAAATGVTVPSENVVQNIEFKADLSSPTVRSALSGYDVDMISKTSGSLLGTHQTAQELAAKGLVITKETPYGSDFTPLAPRPEAAGSSPLPSRLAGKNYQTYFGGYKTVAAYQQFATDIAAAYPELAQYVDYGDSWLKTKGKPGGHDLFALRITSGAQQSSDWQNNANHKPRFVLDGQIHAREIVTSEFTSRFTTELLNGYGSDAEVTALLDSTEIWVIFNSNPDGTAIAESGLSTAGTNSSGDAVPASSSKAWQRKNADNTGYQSSGSSSYSNNHPGVDLNRNWGVGFGGQGTSGTPSAQEYRGPSAMSEPETQQQSAFFTKLFGSHPVSNNNPAPLSTQGTVLTLHSYAGLVIYPYAYDNTVIPPNISGIKDLGFRQSFYNGLTAGAAGDILYNAAGGDIDWIYQKTGVPAYTWEVGSSSEGGFFPSFSRVDSMWQKYRGGIYYAAEAAAAPYQTPAGPTPTALTATRSGSGAVVNATGNDNTYGTKPSQSKPAAQVVQQAEYSLGSTAAAPGTGTALSLADGVANSTTESFTGTIANLPAGQQTLFVRMKDSDGHWGPAKAVFIP
ncbi:M14 family zinc carboxypeptidase [Psychromicrobium sp. YIM B11713]|uniref:M14 family zinc carboxypeptidase n=1 Tax=Psychromicrobium sp. YIM B11713 TaxID=3145233 RepID=UPI00374E9A67